jgi:acyl-CoA thioesterase
LTVAAGFSIELLAAAHLGDLLSATASEVSRSGRSGVYDVEVVSAHGKRVALFRGHSHTHRGKPAVPAAPG